MEIIIKGNPKEIAAYELALKDGKIDNANNFDSQKRKSEAMKHWLHPGINQP